MSSKSRSIFAVTILCILFSLTIGCKSTNKQEEITPENTQELTLAPPKNVIAYMTQDIALLMAESDVIRIKGLGESTSSAGGYSIYSKHEKIGDLNEGNMIFIFENGKLISVSYEYDPTNQGNDALLQDVYDHFDTYATQLINDYGAPIVDQPQRNLHWEIIDPTGGNAVSITYVLNRILISPDNPSYSNITIALSDKAALTRFLYGDSTPKDSL
jgi:hypothetical protein